MANTASLVLALLLHATVVSPPAGVSPPEPSRAPAQTAADGPGAAEAPRGEPIEFTFVSPALSAFWGRPITMRCAVLEPPATAQAPESTLQADGATLPAASPPAVCYIVHGFGGSHRMGFRHGARLAEQVRSGDAPPMLYVYLDASCRFGHHEFADSVNNGPWGEALVREFIPAIESRFGGVRRAGQRFLTGHSSGGWSVLWLQVNYPTEFGGCWATAPDSIDFRDFSGVDLTAATNFYRDDEGQPRPLIEKDGVPTTSIETYVRGEVKSDPIGGQFFSFDAVFSPRGDDGLPMPMFDRESGEIDRAVVQAWRRYDIGHLLRTRWAELAPQLAGKLHVWCGEWDTFRLDGAVRLLKEDLAALGSDADVLLVPERDHGSLFRAHEAHWPAGMERRIRQEMAEAAAADRAQRGARSPSQPRRRRPRRRAARRSGPALGGRSAT